MVAHQSHKLKVVGSSPTPASSINMVANQVISLKSYFDGSGPITPTKKWMDTVSPDTGDGYVVDISSAGFSEIWTITLASTKNTSSATSAVKVSLRSKTTSELVLNIIEGNDSTISLLGSIVALGATEVFADTTDLQIAITVEGI